MDGWMDGPFIGDFPLSRLITRGYCMWSFLFEALFSNGFIFHVSNLDPIAGCITRAGGPLGSSTVVKGMRFGVVRKMSLEVSNSGFRVGAPYKLALHCRRNCKKADFSNQVTKMYCSSVFFPTTPKYFDGFYQPFGQLYSFLVWISSSLLRTPACRNVQKCVRSFLRPWHHLR